MNYISIDQLIIVEPLPSVCNDGDIQLVNGTNGTNDTDDEGRVEYCYNGTWVPVCSLSAKTASFMCQQLGHSQFTCKRSILYNIIIIISIFLSQLQLYIVMRDLDVVILRAVLIIFTAVITTLIFPSALLEIKVVVVTYRLQLALLSIVSDAIVSYTFSDNL